MLGSYKCQHLSSHNLMVELCRCQQLSLYNLIVGSFRCQYLSSYNLIVGSYRCQQLSSYITTNYSSPRVHRLFLGTSRHFRCPTRWLTVINLTLTMEPFHQNSHYYRLCTSLHDEWHKQTDQSAQRGNTQPPPPFPSSTIVIQSIAASRRYSEENLARPAFSASLVVKLSLNRV